MSDFVDNWMARPLEDDKPLPEDEAKELEANRIIENFEIKPEVAVAEQILDMGLLEFADFVKSCTAQQAINYVEETLEYLSDQGQDVSYAEQLLDKTKIAYSDDKSKKSAVFAILDTLPAIRHFNDALGNSCLEDMAIFADADADEIISWLNI